MHFVVPLEGAIVYSILVPICNNQLLLLEQQGLKDEALRNRHWYSNLHVDIQNRLFQISSLHLQSCWCHWLLKWILKCPLGSWLLLSTHVIGSSEQKSHSLRHSWLNTPLWVSSGYVQTHKEQEKHGQCF